MEKKITKQGKWLLLLLFISYYSSITFFTHIHFEGNRMVYHSHPFHSGEHTHSGSTECQLIHDLSSFFLTGGELQTEQLIFSPYRFCRTVELPGIPDQTDPLLLFSLLRAPPVC